MLGSDRPEDFIPLLLEARKQHVQAEFIQQVLTEMGLETA